MMVFIMILEIQFSVIKSTAYSVMELRDKSSSMEAMIKISSKTVCSKSELLEQRRKYGLQETPNSLLKLSVT